MVKHWVQQRADSGEALATHAEEVAIRRKSRFG
jgi:hypothetical protein